MSRAILRDPRLVPPTLRTEGHTIRLQESSGILPYQPAPLFLRAVQQETRRGEHTDFFAVWRTEDAARCRLCPACCNRAEGEDGLSSCVVRRVGPHEEALKGLPDRWQAR